MLYRQKKDTYIRNYDGVGYITSTGLFNDQCTNESGTVFLCALSRRAVKYIQQIYRLEEELIAMNLSSEELISKRKELIKPVFDEFHEWLLEIKPKVPPTLMFGRAINYALSAWNHLLNYLDCPELYEYLRYIFDQAPFCESEKDFEKLLPWNIKITEFNEEGTWKTDA